MNPFELRNMDSYDDEQSAQQWHSAGNFTIKSVQLMKETDPLTDKRTYYDWYLTDDQQERLRQCWLKVDGSTEAKADWLATVNAVKFECQQAADSSQWWDWPGQGEGAAPRNVQEFAGPFPDQSEWGIASQSQSTVPRQGADGDHQGVVVKSVTITVTGATGRQISRDWPLSTDQSERLTKLYSQIDASQTPNEYQKAKEAWLAGVRAVTAECERSATATSHGV